MYEMPLYHVVSIRSLSFVLMRPTVNARGSALDSSSVTLTILARAGPAMVEAKWVAAVVVSRKG